MKIIRTCPHSRRGEVCADCAAFTPPRKDWSEISFSLPAHCKTDGFNDNPHDGISEHSQFKQEMRDTLRADTEGRFERVS